MDMVVHGWCFSKGSILQGVWLVCWEGLYMIEWCNVGVIGRM